MNERQVKGVAEFTRHLHQGALSVRQYHVALHSLDLREDDIRMLSEDARRWLITYAPERFVGRH